MITANRRHGVNLMPRGYGTWSLNVGDPRIAHRVLKLLTYRDFLFA
jgi:hypothetical protein